MIRTNLREKIPQAASDAHPTDSQVRAADDIALFDPNHAEWLEIVVSVRHAGCSSPKHRTVLHIPVNSCDDQCVQHWRDRITALRTGG